MSQRIATVFGGSGFLGRHLIKRLVAQGYQVRAVVRDVQAANFLKPIGDIGQITPWHGNITNMDFVKAALNGADLAVNLVGLLSEFGKQTFERIHVMGAANVAQAASELGVKRLIHLSALGADTNAHSKYASSKAFGEQAVLAAYPDATIMRPSVVFGPEDGFFNKFAALAQFSPVLPVIGAPLIPEITYGDDQGLNINFYGKGGPKFQPVYVGDVADAMMAAVADAGTKGKTFELCGPATYSFKEVMELVMDVTGRRCWLMPVNFIVAELMGFVLGLWPKPMLTFDQVTLLHHDNVFTNTLPGISALGVQAQAAEAILPTHLYRFNRTRKRPAL